MHELLDVDAETQTQAFDNLYIGNWMILKYQIGTRKLKQKALIDKDHLGESTPVTRRSGSSYLRRLFT